MIRINNINTTIKIPSSIISSLIPSDNQVIGLIKDKLGIDIINIISRGTYSADIYIPYVNLYPDETSIITNLNGMVSDNIPVHTSINVDIDTDGIKYSNQYGIIINTSVYTDFKGIEFSGIVNIPISMIGDTIQYIVNIYISRLSICQQYGKCDPCNYNCVPQPCEWYDLICHARESIGTTACIANEAKCKADNLVCYTNEIACQSVKDLLSNVGNTISDAINISSPSLCVLGVQSQYTCKVKNGQFEYEFIYTLGEIKDRKNVGSIRNTQIDIDKSISEIKNSCTNTAKTNNVLLGTFMNIGPINISMGSDNINLTAKVCYSRHTKKFTGPILVISHIESIGDSIIFYGTITRTDDGILISNSDFQIPSTYSNYMEWTNYLDKLDVESIFIDNKIIKSIGLQPVLGKDILDLIEKESAI